MSFVFDVADRTGRKIHLSKERWSHVTSPMSPHAYMINYLEEIKLTLIQPDSIIGSHNDESKVNYYKYAKENKEYFRVIVKYLNGNGFVITAYIVRNISK